MHAGIYLELLSVELSYYVAILPAEDNRDLMAETSEVRHRDTAAGCDGEQRSFIIIPKRQESEEQKKKVNAI